ncbi:MAG: LamG domain-containing protein [Planctomycetota bacterium]
MSRPHRSLSTLSSLGALCGAALAPTAHAQLLHRYSFDGNGTALTDSVGAADGTLMNGATLTGTGELAFDGVDDYVELPGGLASANDAQSFECWFAWNGGANWQRLMDCGDSTGTVGVTYLVLTPQGSSPASAGAVKTPGSPGTLSTKVYSLSQTATGVLTHVCWTFDSAGDSMKLYLDGVFQAETIVSENLSELNDVNCWLGRSQFTQDPYFSGAISEFRIYGHVLSAAEVTASFAAGPGSGGGPGTNYCAPGVANSTGNAAAMGASGSATVANNDLVLEASALPNNAFGFFLTSRTQGMIMNPGGSQGTLCLGGSIGRYVGAGQIKNSGATGAIQLAVDLTQHPTPTGLVSVAPGETWNFQAWFRDSINGTATSNFTDGLEVTFN